MKHIAFGALCLLACGCDSSDERSDYQASDYPVPTVYSTPTDAPSPIPTPTVPARPSHYYDAKDGALYSYIAAISEDERKAGKGAGDVLTYAYLGKRDGKHVLVRVTADGRPLEEAYCGAPCRVITFGDGRQFGFTEGSVIGAAFADAIAGRLEIAVYRSPEAASAQSAQATPPAVAATTKPTNPEAAQLLLWLDAHDKCRWSTDQQERDQVCSTRDQVYGPPLRAAGYCFGKQGEAASNRMLHRCEAGSLPLPTLVQGQ